MKTDPVEDAARDAYVAAWRSPNGEAVGKAVAAGVREALRQAGVDVPEEAPE